LQEEEDEGKKTDTKVHLFIWIWGTN